MDVEPTYEEVLNHMNSMEFSGMKLGIERIRDALRLFGNPEKRLKIIHIAGTNGKGSVAAMLSVMLKNAGSRVGMFTSPHLVDVRERIRINGELISKQDFKDLFLEAKAMMSELTFFELVTLMAVLHFVKQKVDRAIFESGLGGTYDATNFQNDHISVITSISLDHMHILGDSVEQIARDKCGIITEGRKVVTTSSNQRVMSIIRDAVEVKGAGLIVAGVTDLDVSLNGAFQKENAGIAVQVAKELGVPDNIIKESLLEVEWPGRAEFIEKNVLIDCAHNPAGVDALKAYVESLEYDKLVIVFAACRNKDYQEMIDRLPDHDRLIFTQSSIERRLPISAVPDDIDCIKIVDPLEALEHAKSLAGENGLVVVCGSIFLVGDIKSALAADLVHDLVS